MVGYARRNFLVPIPGATSFAELNARLLECAEAGPIGGRLTRDRDALLSLPPVPYDDGEKRAARINSFSLVRYRGNNYSVSTAYGHREVLVRG